MAAVKDNADPATFHQLKMPYARLDRSRAGGIGGCSVADTKLWVMGS